MKNLKRILFCSLVFTFAGAHAATLSDMTMLDIAWTKGQPFEASDLSKYFGPQKEYDAICLEQNDGDSKLGELYGVSPLPGDDQIVFEGKFDFVYASSGRWGSNVTLYPHFTIQGQNLRMSNLKTPSDLSCATISNTGACTLAYDLGTQPLEVKDIIPEAYIKKFGVQPMGSSSLKITMSKIEAGSIIAKVESSIQGVYTVAPITKYISHKEAIGWNYTAYCRLSPTVEKLSALDDLKRNP